MREAGHASRSAASHVASPRLRVRFRYRRHYREGGGKSGAIIGYRNLIDAATLSCVTGAPVAQFPLGNLQTRQLSKICRINGAVSGGTMFLSIKADRGIGASNVGDGIAAVLAANIARGGT